MGQWEGKETQLFWRPSICATLIYCTFCIFDIFFDICAYQGDQTVSITSCNTLQDNGPLLLPTPCSFSFFIRIFSWRIKLLYCYQKFFLLCSYSFLHFAHVCTIIALQHDFLLRDADKLTLGFRRPEYDIYKHQKYIFLITSVLWFLVQEYQ